MNDEEKFLSEEQIDFLTEMMNIGAGNAATALSQMLKCEAEMKIPSVRALQSPKVSFLLEDPSLPVACVRMDMVGDVAGNIFFIVPDEQKTKLIRLMERASGMGEKFNRTDPKSLPSGLEALQAGSGAVGPYGPEAAFRIPQSIHPFPVSLLMVFLAWSIESTNIFMDSTEGIISKNVLMCFFATTNSLSITMIS